MIQATQPKAKNYMLTMLNRHGKLENQLLYGFNQPKVGELAPLGKIVAVREISAAEAADYVFSLAGDERKGWNW